MSSNANARLVFWITPAVGVLLGLAYLVAAIVGGHPGLGLGLFALMVVVSAVTVLASRRSETVRGLLDRRDERLARIDVEATAITGTVLCLAVIVGAVVDIANARYSTPFIWLGALAGVAYLASVIVLRLRG